MITQSSISTFFFFNDTATTEIYTLSLHDALPISRPSRYEIAVSRASGSPDSSRIIQPECASTLRSEEHTSELQSQSNLVCRLLLEKKKNTSEGGLRMRLTITSNTYIVTAYVSRAC